MFAILDGGGGVGWGWWVGSGGMGVGWSIKGEESVLVKRDVQPTLVGFRTQRQAYLPRTWSSLISAGGR